MFFSHIDMCINSSTVFLNCSNDCFILFIILLYSTIVGLWGSSPLQELKRVSARLRN